MTTFNCLDDINIWCNKILPTVFDDSLSYLESIFRLKTIVKTLIEAVNKLTESNTELTNKYQEVLNKLNTIEQKLNDITTGDIIQDGTITLNKLSDDVIEMLKMVVADTVPEIAKFVWFGLSDDGYFMACIPDNWTGIEFDTTDKGELVLKY